MTFDLEKDAPSIRAAERNYSYKFRLKPRMCPEFYQLIKRWSEIELGEVRRLPGTYIRESTKDLGATYRAHFRKYANEAGLYAGLHYGIQTDLRDNCLKIVKLGEPTPGKMREDFI